MIQRRCGPCFPDKALFSIAVGKHLRRQYFYCNYTFQVGVSGLVNLAHSTRANFLEDLVVGDFPTDHWSEYYTQATAAPKYDCSGTQQQTKSVLRYSIKTRTLIVETDAERPLFDTLLSPHNSPYRTSCFRPKSRFSGLGRPLVGNLASSSGFVPGPSTTILDTSGIRRPTIRLTRCLPTSYRSKLAKAWP